MRRLSDQGHQVDVKILDNEVSGDFKRTILEYWCETYQLTPPNVHRRNIVEDWCATYQLVPPNVHRINISERDIRTFKAHFLSVLDGVDHTFPKFMW